MLEVNVKTWVIADTHFGHKNIIKYCNRPRNHNSIMLRNWKKYVKKTDVILHLGDVCVWYDNRMTWASKVYDLPGKKYLILGNHDDDQQWTDEEWLAITGMTVINPFLQNQVYFSHEADEQGWDWVYNIHGHSHTHAPFRAYTRYGGNYYNASIEAMRYKPTRLGTILKQLVI